MHPLPDDSEFEKVDVLLTCKRIPETYFSVASMTKSKRAKKKFNQDMAHMRGSKVSLNIVEVEGDEGLSEDSDRTKLMTADN